MPADVAGSRGHQVRVLEQLAELARRLHRSERRQRTDSGVALWHSSIHSRVLPRKSGARADQVLDEHLPGRLGVAELEARQHLW